MDSMYVEHVIFLTKPWYHKQDCIGVYAPWECTNDSLFVAVIADMGFPPQIRCCADERCQAMAGRMARDRKIFGTMKMESSFRNRNSSHRFVRKACTAGLLFLGAI